MSSLLVAATFKSRCADFKPELPPHSIEEFHLWRSGVAGVGDPGGCEPIKRGKIKRFELARQKEIPC